MRSSVLDSNQMIIVGEVDWFTTIQNLIIKIIINENTAVISELLRVFHLTMVDTVEAAVVLIGGLLPHPLVVGDGAEEDVHHHLLLHNVLSLVLAANKIHCAAYNSLITWN